MSGNETQVASFPGFVCLGASSRVRRSMTSQLSLPARSQIQILTKTEILNSALVKYADSTRSEY